MMSLESDTSEPAWRELAIAGYFVAIVALALFLMISPKLADGAGQQALRASLKEHRGGMGAGIPRSSVDAADAASIDGTIPPAASENDDAKLAADGRPADTGGRSADGSFMPLDFSLPGGSRLDNSVEAATEGSINVRKVVKAGNSEVGAINVTIDQNSRLLLDAGDVRTLVASYPGGSKRTAELPQSGLMTTRALRELGIDFRYDPNADVISLELR